MNIDRTHKENILYIKEGTNVKTISSFNLSDITLEDIFNEIKIESEQIAKTVEELEKIINEVK